MYTNQSGMVHPLVVTSIVLGVLVLALGGFGTWAFINYQDFKNNTDAKVSAAVTVAKREQSNADEAAFAEREKQPVRQLVGPEDLGRVTVDYPKTWSLYIDKDGQGGDYEAYLHPGAVQATSKRLPYALRVSVVSQSYEDSVKDYESDVEKGELKATPITIQGQTGTRLDGNFSDEIQGSLVLFKLRDKTIRIATESRDFTGDFNSIILASLKFNP